MLRLGRFVSRSTCNGRIFARNGGNLNNSTLLGHRSVRTVHTQPKAKTSSNNSRTLFGSLFALTAVASAVFLTNDVAEASIHKDKSYASKSKRNNHDNTQKSVSKYQGNDFSNMKVFSGRANQPLATEIAEYLGIQLGSVNIRDFADGEIGIQVNENVRGKDVYLIQPTCPPGVNNNLMELILLVSTMRRASAETITCVIPYYGYARQDRKMASRVPISAADVASLLESVGADRIVAVDLHCGQIQGFFGPRTPCDNLEGHVVAFDYFKNQNINSETTKIVSPDAGGVYRAKQFRQGMKTYGVDAGLAMIIKQRAKANAIESMDLVGEVDGSDVIMVDDMIDTAGTLTKAAQLLKDKGAKRVFAFATHGLFSGKAYQNIGNSCLEKVVVTNTIPLKEGAPANIEQLSIAELLSDAIARVHLKKSVSALFMKKEA